MADLSHINKAGEVHMVEVGEKANSKRFAKAQAVIKMQPETFKAVIAGNLKKGEALGVARTAGIMAAKKTSSLIPLCHPLFLTGVEVNIFPNEEESSITIESKVKCVGPTGVEMEALTAVTVAALTIYDMAKALDRAMVIESVYLLEKSGGQSGHFINPSLEK